MADDRLAREQDRGLPRRGRLARRPDIEEAVKFRQTRDSACGPRRLCAMLTMAEPLASVA